MKNIRDEMENCPELETSHRTTFNETYLKPAKKMGIVELE